MKLRAILKIAFLIIYVVGIVAVCKSLEYWNSFRLGIPLNPRPTPLPLPSSVAVERISATPEVFENGYRLRLNTTVTAYISYAGRSEVSGDFLTFTRAYIVQPNSNRGPASLMLSTESNFREGNGYWKLYWMLIIAFPWIEDSLTQPVTYPILWDLQFYSAPPPNTDSAGAELEVNGLGVNNKWYCRIYQDGYITLLSTDPLVGEFQFFCQFDSTDYAQVSGRFWE